MKALSLVPPRQQAHKCPNRTRCVASLCGMKSLDFITNTVGIEVFYVLMRSCQFMYGDEIKAIQEWK